MPSRSTFLLSLPLPLLAFATACSPEAQVKREPGSWSQKIEIVKLEGKGATPEAKAQMQKMFDAMSGLSVCLTSAAANKEDLGKNLEQMGSQGKNCTFSRRDVTGSTIGFDATCKQPDGGTMKLVATGTNSPTEQDVTLTMDGSTAAGAHQGSMEMRVRSSRSGECKPGDITPPDTPPAPKP